MQEALGDGPPVVTDPLAEAGGLQARAAEAAAGSSGLEEPPERGAEADGDGDGAPATEADREDQHRGEAGTAALGQHPTEDQGGLAGDHEAEEDRCLEEGQQEDGQVEHPVRDAVERVLDKRSHL